MTNLQDIANQLLRNQQSRRDKEQLKFERQKHNDIVKTIVDELEFLGDE